MPNLRYIAAAVAAGLAGGVIQHLAAGVVEGLGVVLSLALGLELLFLTLSVGASFREKGHLARPRWP